MNWKVKGYKEKKAKLKQEHKTKIFKAQKARESNCVGSAFAGGVAGSEWTGVVSYDCRLKGY